MISTRRDCHVSSSPVALVFTCVTAVEQQRHETRDVVIMKPYRSLLGWQALTAFYLLLSYLLAPCKGSPKSNEIVCN